MRDRTMCLLPWTPLINALGAVYGRCPLHKNWYYVIKTAGEKWGNDLNGYHYDTAEEAMKQMDNWLKEQGYILLTEEMMVLI